MSREKLTVDAEMERLQQVSFSYFLHETNPANGLVIDKTQANCPASIAATGLAFASYPVAQQTPLLLAVVDFLREFAKLLGLFVTRLYLQLCELSRFLARQERNQSLKLNCRFARVVGLFQHQMFEFPH
jgi:hypothetical protein